MRKSEVNKRLKQYITNNSDYGWRLRGDRVYFATYRNSKGKATDYTNYQGTIAQWQYELDNRKVG